MAITNRRVVTGLDANGRSCFIFDGPLPSTSYVPGSEIAMIWQTDRTPASNEGSADAACDESALFSYKGGGSKFMLYEQEPSDRIVGLGMHATNTIDYIVMLEGEITLVVETGEIKLSAGDVLVDRGIVHGWRNDGPAMAKMAVVGIDAQPVGAGATI